MRKFLVWMYAPDFPLWSMPEDSVERIRETLGPGWRVEFLEEELHATGDGTDRVPDVLLEEVADAEVYCAFGIPPEVFRAGRRLRWVHSGAAGVGGSLHPEMRGSDVIFTNAAGLHAEPMSEHAMAFILHFARGLDLAVAGKAERRWRHGDLAGRGSPVRELTGRTVGVVGYGGVGSAVGRRAAALGMQVVAVRRDARRVPEEVGRMWPPDGLDALLEEADYAVVTVPETEETRSWIGAEELDRLGEDGVLINLSRGTIVVEEDLVEALDSGRIRGAGLDVFREEPLPATSPLWKLENVIITPHSAGVSRRFWERHTELLVDNVRRYLRGEPLKNVVDKKRGY